MSLNPSARRSSYVVWSDAAGFVPPDIVHYEPANSIDAKRSSKLDDAVRFLQDAVEKMTGHTLSVRGTADLSHGIVFTTLTAAPPDVENDPKVRAALADDGTGAYNANEAYYVRTETDRTILVANTDDGLVNAAADLAESAGYQVLGMGPNWVDFPDRSRSLVFDTECGGRPGYYLRLLWPTSGQSHGHGTIDDEESLSDPDETVTASYRRWRVGARLAGRSVPTYPGHALQNYHQKVAAHIRETGDTAGFLAPTRFDLDERRPDTPPSTPPEQLWINSDRPPAPAAGKVYLSVNGAWVEQRAGAPFALSLDVSVPVVRKIVLDGAKAATEAAFDSWPNDVAQMAIEPEDGGPSDEEFNRYRKNPRWFPDYLEQNGLPFGRPYALHGSFGLDQPDEQWDETSRSDTMYGFALWMLHEYDRWIDQLAPAQRVTRVGVPKKSLIRASFASYNHHDVPPNFNIDDPRVRVLVAGNSPKHRGTGKWTGVRTDIDVFKALRVWLPDPGTYRITSHANPFDWGMSGLPVAPDLSPTAISDSLSLYYDAGARAITDETDFNFGKFGLGYYLTAKKMWNPAMSAADLDAIRDQWLQRAFGSAWLTMKEYYDFLLASNYPVNSTSSWGHAIQLVTEADQRIDPATEPSAKRRIDDLKQYWYFYFLYATNKMTPAAPETREFVWKGQMSYMNAMHALMTTVYGTTDPAVVAGPETSSGPAHYAEDETADWWQQVRGHWPEVPVDRFEDTTLADGTPAKDVDQNDLALVDEFVSPGTYGPFIYNADPRRPVAFLTRANRQGEPIGFTLWWPQSAGAARDLYYGLQWWNPGERSWTTVLDQRTTSQPVTDPLIHIEMPAPRSGVFRFRLGQEGNLVARLAPLTYDYDANHSTGRSAHTYFELALGITQGPAYFYIPKGTRSLDLDVWSDHAPKTLRIYSGLLSGNPAAPYRDKDVTAWETHRITLRPGEDGTVARFSSGTRFHFPYLHSVPRLWAKSPAELMVPRAIATADGLTVVASKGES